MATRVASLSKPDRQGHYARQLGWKINQGGKRVPNKFRLGTDRSAAEVREALLRRVHAVKQVTMSHQKSPTLASLKHELIGDS